MATARELMARKAELEKQAADLARQIEQAHREERSGVIAQIKTLMAEHGVTLADLGGSGRAKAAKPAKAGAGRSSGLAGTKVPPKYRNKATGETWSGRGLQPRWLKAALASGGKLSDFEL